ncbi:DUF2461 domain-containing protein [Roseomonas sp. CCTCC AB2023176]|uniref:DUF2461 domain-containing protein n=1 Tax=Roseomonas sp. CCTCC AB2023176 TaxID=3342640 RepID=UPI0035DB2D54
MQNLLPDEMMPKPFEGFAPDGFAFLTELAERQDRTWFNDNRHRYEAALRDPMAALLAALSDDLAARKIPLRADPKRSVFRIHRDVRFSRDKSPYKTHIGATLTRDGSKMADGLLYLHVDPAAPFAAAGFYQPAPPELDAIRQAVAGEPAAFRRMLTALSKSGLALSPDEDAAKRTPRGFETVEAPDLLDALRRKSFIVRRPLTRDELSRPGLVTAMTDFAAAAMPLLRFGWKALDGYAG